MGRIDRTGKENVNNFGSKMIISKYNNNRDMDVYFPAYNWTAKNVAYDAFKKGNIRCPYERRVHGKGYIGIGEYSSKENDKITKCYTTWQNMLQRCYDDDFKKREPTYQGCEVCTEWHDFQVFAHWYNDNYYQIEDEVMNLDKDILVKGNKIYSPETCVFVSKNINSLFVKRNKSRGDLPIGVYYNKQKGKYMSRCSFGYGENIYLGVYSTKEEAFRVYKQYKEKIIKEVIDSYEGKIPEPHYSRLRDAMYNYEVEIDD